MFPRLLALVLLLSLAGCVVEAPRRVAVVGEVRIPSGPPAPRVEVVPPPPAPYFYWVSGHWQWDGRGYDWHPGHWVEPRPAEAYVRPYWANERGEWVFHPGRWVPVAQPREYVEVITNRPPPMPRLERIPPAPSSNHFWINGHWQWDGGQHRWVEGRWEAHRPDQVWIAAHWTQSGNNWRLSGGFWQRLP